MTVLLTGSAGFIGFHLARALLARGERVIGLDNMNAYYDVALKQQRHAMLGEHAGFTAVLMDLAEADRLAALVAAERPRLVVHLAAQAGVRHALKAPRDYVDTNITGSFNLLEACRAAPPEHLMMASTSSVYGASEAMPFREDDPADTALNIYAASKRAMEVMAHGHAHLWGLPITTFRFFTVYGPWGRPDMALFRFTDAILKGEPIRVHNHGEMERDFTYIDDLVEALLRLSALPPRLGEPAGAADTLSRVAPYRCVNIGPGAPVKLLDLIAEIERAIGMPALRELVPIHPGELPRTWAENAALRAVVGELPATPLAAGVAAFVRWFRGHYAR